MTTFFNTFDWYEITLKTANRSYVDNLWEKSMKARKEENRKAIIYRQRQINIKE